MKISANTPHYDDLADKLVQASSEIGVGLNRSYNNGNSQGSVLQYQQIFIWLVNGFQVYTFVSASREIMRAAIFVLSVTLMLIHVFVYSSRLESKMFMSHSFIYLRMKLLLYSYIKCEYILRVGTCCCRYLTMPLHCEKRGTMQYSEGLLTTCTSER